VTPNNNSHPRARKSRRARADAFTNYTRACACACACVRLCKCMYGRLGRGRDATTSLDTCFCTHPQAIVRASLVICSIWADTNSSDVIRVAKITAIALYIGWVDRHFPPGAWALSLWRDGSCLCRDEYPRINERLDPFWPLFIFTPNILVNL